MPRSSTFGPRTLGAGSLIYTPPPSYSTTFSLTESPISEGGVWVNNGLDWTLVNTSGGVAFGTQVGGGFDDSYANLSSITTPDVQITATVFKGTTSGIQEIELRFRCSDGPHVSNCYEINFAHDGQYCDFVRWPGPIGTQTSDFTFLVPSLTYTIPGGVNNGDRIRASIKNNALNAWIDKGSGFVAINSSPVVDTSGPGNGAVLTSGSPGIGFFKTSGSGAMNQYCFTDLSVIGI